MYFNGNTIYKLLLVSSHYVVIGIVLVAFIINPTLVGNTPPSNLIVTSPQ